MRTRGVLLVAGGLAALSSCAGITESAPTINSADDAIAACWNVTASERQSSDPTVYRARLVTGTSCLRQEFLRQYRALGDVHVQLASRVGLDGDAARRQYLADYEARIESGNCLPFCFRLEDSGNLEAEAKAVERLIRDMTAERDLYHAWLTTIPDQEILGRYSGAQRIPDACRALSGGMQSSTPAMAVWGQQRSIRCLEYAYLDRWAIRSTDASSSERRAVNSMTRFREHVLSQIREASPPCPSQACDIEGTRQDLRAYAWLLEFLIQVTTAGLRSRVE